MPTHTVSALSRTLVAVLAACAMSAAGAATASASADSVFSSARQMTGSSSYLVQVDINAASLQSAKPGQVFQIKLPGVGNFQVVFDGLMPKAGGNQWLGHLKDGVQYSVVLLQTGEGMTGDIRTPQGAFRLGYANGTQWLTRQGVAGSGTDTLASLPRLLQSGNGSAQATASSAGSRSGGGTPAKVAYPVNFNLVAMSGLAAGAEVGLDVPGKGTYPVIYEGTRANDSGSTTWVGYLKDYGDDFRVLITTGPDGSVGNILTPSGELELTTTAGKQWLIDRSASGWTLLHPDEGDGVAPGVAPSAGGAAHEPGVAAGGIAMGGTASATATTTTTTPKTAGATTSTGATQVDVLILYTPGFVTRNGTTWRTRIDQLVALANQAYVDSGVAIQLRAVGVEQVSYSDQTTNSTALSLLTGSSGAFSNVAALRKQYGADLVTLIRPFYMTAQGQNCGVGYIGGYGGSNIAAYANYAYSVVSDGRDVAGTSYYCTDYTFAHELGHNMGSMHDRATVTSQGGGTGAYPYAFGYGKSGSFGTVMSYISPVVGKFSNPNVSTCGGTQACGVPSTNTASSADNAQSLNNTSAAVAAFMSATASTTYQIAGVVSRSGAALAGVSFGITGTGASCSASASNGTYSCSVPAGWSGTVTPSLTGNTFTPASLNYTALAASQTNQNYAATLIPVVVKTVKISGYVMGRKISGVKFAITGTGASCTNSAANGSYACTVPSGWTGTVIPSLGGSNFFPYGLAYRSVSSDLPNQNYLSY
ncbi:MAG: M12 family metallo-peptidase [Rhodocyclaceae bacterium]|nr:M12 family metallo-peptidase [Rhodocyclaceae bacterium]